MSALRAALTTTALRRAFAIAAQPFPAPQRARSTNARTIRANASVEPSPPPAGHPTEPATEEPSTRPKPTGHPTEPAPEGPPTEPALEELPSEPAPERHLSGPAPARRRTAGRPDGVSGVWRQLVTLLAVASLLTAGCARDPQSAVPHLDWADCADGFECAKLDVPLNHANPTGDRIKISVIRLPATGDRIGSLLVNPGGPGSSGLDYARAARSILSAQVRDRFDVVGFDPRGVGESTPVHCLSDERLDAFIALDTTPDSAAERTKLADQSRAFAAGCQAESGRLLPHIGTADAARDMDLLRQALGEDKLTYLGKSYGTYLGAHYAHLFPGKVRALVLDGAVDPALTRLQLNEQQAKGFVTAFRAFANNCFTQDDCPFTSRTVEGALDELTELLRRTDSTPLDGDGRQVTEALATLGALTPLYDRAGWPILTEALRQAAKGDGRLLLRSADQLVGRGEDGRYSNQTEANLAVNCIDSPYPTNLTTYATAANKTSSPFGAYVMWSSLPCAYWPAKPAPQQALQGKGAPPILVIGTIRDPATPYQWSKSLAGELESGVLLTFNGDGHTAYFNGSRCVDELVDRYLISTTPPKDGTVCPDIN